MQETLSVALLGYGYAGRTFHAPLIASVPGLRLTVVGSGNPAKVHVDLPEADVGTVEEVLARPGVDVVVIATPNDTHVDLARRRRATTQPTAAASRSCSRTEPASVPSPSPVCRSGRTTS